MFSIATDLLFLDEYLSYEEFFFVVWVFILKNVSVYNVDSYYRIGTYVNL